MASETWADFDRAGVAECDRFGYLMTDDAPSRALVRIADVVRSLATRDRMPLKRAAAVVADSIGKVSAWFMARPGDYPAALSDADEWRPGFQSGREQRAEHARQDAEWRAAGLVVLSPTDGCIDAEQAALRGMLVDTSDPQACIGPYLMPDEWDALPALPALRGVLGLAEWMREQWADKPTKDCDVDEGLLGRLSMLRSEAAAFFGCGGAEPVQLRAVPIQKATPSVKVEPVSSGAELWPHVKGAPWVDEQLEAIVSMLAADKAWKEIEAETGATKARIEAALKNGNRPSSKIAAKAHQSQEAALGRRA